MTSPFLDLADAVPGEGPTAGSVLHYGSFFAEQRALLAGDGVVDRADQAVFRVAGRDRLTLLHALTTQFFEGLQPGRWVSALILSPQGHVEQAFTGVDDGAEFWAYAEPDHAAGAVAFLERMKFMMEVTAEVTPSRHVVEVAGSTQIVDAETRGNLARHLPGKPVGLWAYEAIRIARGVPRYGVDTDARTIPNEVGLADAVHLDKGCYRGQETVARVHNLGKPPRRLVRLHLDGLEVSLPTRGAEIRVAGQDKVIGLMGSSARHLEDGPIGLSLIKRNVDPAATLVVEGISATQEVLVDPEVGLHVRRRFDL